MLVNPHSAYNKDREMSETLVRVCGTITSMHAIAEVISYKAIRAEMYFWVLCVQSRLSRSKMLWGLICSFKEACQSPFGQ